MYVQNSNFNTPSQVLTFVPLNDASCVILLFVIGVDTDVMLNVDQRTDVDRGFWTERFWSGLSMAWLEDKKVIDSSKDN